MKLLNIIISIPLLLWSCSENSSKGETVDIRKTEQNIVEIETNTADAELLQEVKAEKVDSVSKSLIANAPCIELQEFVIEIEKLNWVSDPARLNKVRIYDELEKQKVEYFNGRPFYPIYFENSRLNKMYDVEFYRSHFDSLDVELFKGVKNIWGYFYRDKDAVEWISDGVIEQWEFESENQADKALKQIQGPGFIIYFNTNPYFCRLRNKLIIFQSRAMAFSYDQKAIFEKFVIGKIAKGGIE